LGQADDAKAARRQASIFAKMKRKMAALTPVNVAMPWRGNLIGKQIEKLAVDLSAFCL